MAAGRYAITGGIGSGKSYVGRILAERGIRVYDCDAEAKRLMRSSEELKATLTQLVGTELYAADGSMNKRALASFLLASEENKQAVNAVVHPAVARDFACSGLEWLESAIFFDSGFDRRLHFDYVVCVAAPLETRLSRVMQRDGISREMALAWVNRQLPQAELRRRSDYVIVNDGKCSLSRQIDEMLLQITNFTTK